MNRQQYIAKAVRRNAVARHASMRFVFEYLATHPCVDCGESDVVVLEFDHLRDKVKDISRMCSDAWSVDAIKAEIDKCDVVCANCHRRRTASRSGWRRLDQVT